MPRKDPNAPDDGCGVPSLHFSARIGRAMVRREKERDA
jgi:hypothetical protein